MKTSDFYYDLPKELIAQDPLEDRSSSRLLHLSMQDGSFEHRHFTDILDYLHKGDCLVINDTKVIPARLYGHKEETGAVITIEEIDGMGRIEVSGTNKKCIDDAMRMIKAIVAVPEVGEVYKGKVRSIMPYGAFIEFLPGKDGLLHISEIDWKRLETVEEAGIKEGDEIDVKLLDIDPKTGKFKLSRKVLLPRPERQERPEKK